MSGLSLEKKAEAVGLVLTKAGLPNPPPMRVCFVIDDSGSMSPLYQKGDVQSVFDQILGAALKLDDDGNVDTWLFHNYARKIATADRNDYGTFIKDKVLTRNDLWGGTSYAPAFAAVRDEMFGANVAPAPAKKGGLFGGMFAKPEATPTAVPASGSNDPVLAFFLTDGDASDNNAAEQVLRETANLPIYWNLVALGTGGSFRFLREMADKYDHVGFIQLSRLNMSDDEMYKSLFTDEFVDFVKKL